MRTHPGIAFFLAFIAAFFVFLQPASTQVVERNIKFSSVNEVGLLAGEKDEALVLQMINGIKKDKWFAGIGAALDLYANRSVPLFLGLRRDLLSAKNTPFVYANAGANFLWLNSIQKEQLFFPAASTGAYYDLGLGWKLSGKNSRGFIVSAGYTLKQVRYKVLSHTVFPPPEQQTDYYDRFNFLFRRVVFKIGFQL